MNDIKPVAIETGTPRLEWAQDDNRGLQGIRGGSSIEFATRGARRFSLNSLSGYARAPTLGPSREPRRRIDAWCRHCADHISRCVCGRPFFEPRYQGPEA